MRGPVLRLSQAQDAPPTLRYHWIEQQEYHPRAGLIWQSLAQATQHISDQLNRCGPLKHSESGEPRRRQVRRSISEMCRNECLTAKSQGLLLYVADCRPANLRLIRR